MSVLISDYFFFKLRSLKVLNMVGLNVIACFLEIPSTSERVRN